MGRERQEREKRCGPKRDAKPRWMSPSATPATQNQSRCLQVPRLPRETKVDVSVWQRCAWQNGERWWLTKMVWERWRVKDGETKMVCKRWCVWKMACERWWWTNMVDKDMCERCWLTKMVDKDGVWKMVVDKYCVCKKMVRQRFCVKDDCVTAGGGRRTGDGGREADPGYRIKNKNPTQRCGEKEREETLTTNWFISGFALLSVTDNNKPLVFISYVWNFRLRDIILFTFLFKRCNKVFGLNISI